MSNPKKFVFFATTKDIDTYIELYKQIMDIFRLNNLDAIDPWLVDNYPHNNITLADRTSDLTDDTHSQLSKAEFAVAEFTKKSRTVIFQAMLAIEKKVPLLCLVSSDCNENIPSIIRLNTSPLISIIEYQDYDVLKEKISEYLIDTKPLKRRFNVMLNIRTLKELEGLSQKLDMPKSELIRMLISKEYKKTNLD